MTQTINWQANPAGPIPLHTQFEAYIKQQISVGLWRAGDKIPSERELRELTGLSRATIRHTLMSLVHQNLLEKVHGSGTYVAFPKIEQPLQTTYSFSEQFRQLGHELHDTVIRHMVSRADETLAGRLSVPIGTEVITIERLRRLQDRPMMVSIAYIPQALCPGLASTPITGSLYHMLSEHYGLPVIRAFDKLIAISASKRLASQLGLCVDAPLMYVERIAYTTGDRTLHLGENFIRGDTVSFSIDLQARQIAALELKESAVR